MFNDSTQIDEHYQKINMLSQFWLRLWIQNQTGSFFLGFYLQNLTD